MQTRGECKRAEGTVRRHSDIVRFGHDGDLAGLGDSSSVRNVGLDDVDATELKVGSAVFASKKTLAEGDGDGGLVVEVLELVGVPGKEGFLDEERAVGFEKLSELLGHGLVDSAVEVTEISSDTTRYSQSNVHTNRLDLSEPLDRLVQRVRRVEPCDTFGRLKSARIIAGLTFILTRVNPCAFLALACSSTSEGRSPPTQP
jgi:hypothetical protein